MQTNKLQTAPIPKLLATMAMPAIIANLVNSLYNIVDQIFIGHGVGYLGNAATSVAFPLTIICLAFGLTLGLGGASNFNLSLGRGQKERAAHVIGNAIFLSLALGVLIGAVIILLLKPLLILFGATDATLISQILSALFLGLYFRRFKSIHLKSSDFRLDRDVIKSIVSVGSSSFIFQSSTMLIQIVTNNMLRKYGAESIYGSDIAIAVAGIVMKINSLFIAVIIGLVQGAQPIVGFNYGARQLERVKETTALMLKTAIVISLVAFLAFELFPKPFLTLFGHGSALYFQFGIKYVRVFLFFVILNGVQIASTTFFQAIGKASIGAFLSLTKQVIFLLPLLFILPHFFGVEGVMFAGPISDAIAFITALTFLRREFKRMPHDLRVTH